MERLGTKERHEQETEEVERLVRPSPKIKPPRHDRRRERVEVDDDQDLDTSDKDLSKNYKVIGGTYRRFAKTDLISVRRKSDGKVVQVSEETLKSEGSEYEEIKDEPKSDPSATAQAIRDQAESDPKLQGFLKDFTNPKSETWPGMLEGNPKFPLGRVLPGVQFPEGIKTIEDLYKVMKAAPSAKKPAPEKKPKKPAPEQATPEATKPPVEPKPDAQPAEPKPAEAQPAAAPAQPAAAPDAQPQAPSAAAGGGASSPPPAKGGKPEKPKKPKPQAPLPSGQPTRPASRAEVLAAKDLIVRTFPTERAASLLLLRPSLHPDEINSLVSDYNVARSVSAKNVDELRSKVSKFYATDPAQAPKPSKAAGLDGKMVAIGELPPEEQAQAIRKHQLRAVALTLGAESAITKSLIGSGTPPSLAQKLSSFMLSGRGEQPDSRHKRGAHDAEVLFYDQIAAQPEPASDDTVRKTLEATNDLGAKQLAVGYFQASDYHEARNKFLDPKSPEHISERQSSEDIARGLVRATRFLRKLGERYPEGATVQDTALTFRTRVMRQLATVLPSDTFHEVQDRLDVADNKDYDTAVKRYEKAATAYKERQAKAEDDAKKLHAEWSEKVKQLRAENKPFDLDPPMGSKDLLATQGVFEPKPPPKPPRYDLQKKPKDLQDSAAQLWDEFSNRQAGDQTLAARVAVRFVFGPFSTYSHAPAMGHDRQAVYLGVEPNEQGPYVGWQQPQACDLGDRDFTRILTAAREWLRTPVLSTNIEGIVRDTQLRAALDLAISTENYSAVLHPTIYNNLLARLAGEPQTETLVTVTAADKGEIPEVKPGSRIRADKTSVKVVKVIKEGWVVGSNPNGSLVVCNFNTHPNQQKWEGLEWFKPDEMDEAVEAATKRSKTARTNKMPKDTIELKQAQVDHFIAGLDRLAATVQEKHESWGMKFAAAKDLVLALDKYADELEKAAYGDTSLTLRQAEVLKTAEVIQRDSDEKYMDTFKSPTKPIQTEADEPYMRAYADDDTSGVHHGKAENGRPLAP